MKNLVIIGAGGHGKVCLEIALKMNMWNKIVFMDDNKTGFVNGIQIKEKINLDNISAENEEVFIAIGDNKLRSKIANLVKQKKLKLVKLIDNNVLISRNVKIDVGTVIMPGSIINSSVRIGEGVIINTGSIIEHDCTISNYVHIAPRATILGNVSIGMFSFVGANSTINNAINICDNTIVGSNSLVIRDVKNPGTYVGSPVRKLM